MKKPNNKSLYFAFEDAEICYLFHDHLDIMKIHKQSKRTLFEAKRVTNTNYFFCKHFQQVGEKGDCGKQCNAYQPRNKVSGSCIHNGYCYEPTGEAIEITIKI